MECEVHVDSEMRRLSEGEYVFYSAPAAFSLVAPYVLGPKNAGGS